MWPAVKLLAHRWWSESVGGSKRAEVDHPSVRWAWAARAWAVGGVSHKEFCVKVLKFEIVNSQKSSIYFSGVVP